jgi:plastocyanin
MRFWQRLTAMTVALVAVSVGAARMGGDSYLPTGGAAKSVTVTKAGAAAAGVVVLTQALAIKETGPKETVARFGETYAFSPAVFAVRRDEPTLVTFRNLQPDDVHDFMLTDASDAVLMKVELPPLTDTAYVFTFHREGVFPFYCTMHQPAMSGQILVLAPKSD